MSEPHFYRLRKEAVGTTGDPNCEALCGRDLLTLVLRWSNSKLRWYGDPRRLLEAHFASPERT
jgi:hypothetical protein